MTVSTQYLVLVFGIFGNIISLLVMLSPIPTFVSIYKKGSTQGFQSVPYVASLLSAMLWLYYALHKSDSFLLMTINSVGCVVQTIYIAIFIIYATKDARVLTLKLLVIMNLGGFGVAALITEFAIKESYRAMFLGWICVGFATSVFAAPLVVIREVVHTKSVEFMPFFLSFSLTLSAVMWLAYGLLKKDLYVAIPNVLGLLFGCLQMILYGIYKNKKGNITIDLPKELERSSELSNNHQVRVNQHAGAGGGGGDFIVPVMEPSEPVVYLPNHGRVVVP